MRFFWVDFHRFFVVIIVLHFPFFYRRLGDEMRSMSLEKSRQREAELAQEIERLQMEIKTLQKNSEEAANVNQQLSKEVRKNSFDIFLMTKHLISIKEGRFSFNRT